MAEPHLEGENGKRRSTLILVASAVFLLGALAIANLVAPQKISATRPRPSEEFDRLLGNPGFWTTLQSNTSSQISIVTNAQEIVCESVTVSTKPVRIADAEVFQAGANQVWKKGDREIALIFLGVGPISGAPSPNPIPLKIYGPDFKRVLDTNLVNQKAPDFFNSYSSFGRAQGPQVKVLMNQSGFGKTQLRGSRILDHNTHQIADSGGASWVYADNYFQFETRLNSHQARPLDIVIDFWSNPSEIASSNIVRGETLTCRRGKWTLVTNFNRAIAGWGSSSTPQAVTNRFSLRKADVESDKTFSVIFQFEGEEGIPHQWKAFGKDGRELQGRGNNNSGNLEAVQWRGDSTDIARIELIVFETPHRVVFTLPTLPGAALLSRDDDLRSLKIPSVKINNEWELQQLVQETLQLKLRVDPPRYRPVSSFTFEGTAGDLLARYRKETMPFARMEVNYEKGELCLKQTVLTTVVERVRKWLRK